MELDPTNKLDQTSLHEAKPQLRIDPQVFKNLFAWLCS